MRTCIVVTVLACPLAFCADDTAGVGARLAEPSERAAAVDQIVRTHSPNLSALLLWTKKPPKGLVGEQIDGFYAGLAEVFGRLRANDAIPFLIANITVQRSLELGVWTKSEKGIEYRLPAAAALVQIGPASARPLMEAYWGASTPERRLTIVFVLSRLAAKGTDDPYVKEFLHRAIAQAKLELEWAEDGVRTSR